MTQVLLDAYPNLHFIDFEKMFFMTRKYSIIIPSNLYCLLKYLTCGHISIFKDIATYVCRVYNYVLELDIIFEKEGNL